MFGLERDFIQQDGITMLLGRSGGLSAGELNMVQARMLMTSGIPYHLRLLLREIDLQVTLEYTLARRKMLGALLKSGKLSMTEFFGLMLQIAAGMEEGQLYMLRTEQYALHEDFIFIEGPLSSGKVFLTYVPLELTEPARKPGEALKSLIMVFMGAIRELSGDGIQRLLQYCGEEVFSPAGLKELLAEMLTEGTPHKGHVEETEPARLSSMAGTGTSGAVSGTRIDWAQPPDRRLEEPGRERSAAAAFSHVHGDKESQPSGSMLNPTPWGSGTPQLKRQDGLSGAQTANGTTMRPVPAEDKQSSYRTYILLGALLGDALLWKFLYLNAPRALWLAVCAAVTLILAAACWLVWSGRLAWGEAEEERDALEERPEDDNSTARNRKLRSDLEWDFSRNPVDQRRSPVPVYTPQNQEANAGQSGFTAAPAGRQRAPAGMTASSPQKKEAAMATALLTREPVQATGSGIPKAGRAVPYLERSDQDDGGAPERIELNRPSFIIGRSSEVAQYIEKSEGASRVHAEISRASGSYILKDLDSRNGTLLGGEAMVPYKEYPLTEGTVFTIVKGTYTFHTT
ncbi:FHA domain-containing protein [Paenibacillus sp. FSL H7-0350]|uniref:FHA domain-containing protein n=1 Tax=Paenibacillus sp. FSL H7-0350 TaxID=2975345 RepID=UPI003158384E